ncbi:hypothetical protein PR002_g10610 [Phytophthora rubi]|uniref:Uncharacterized protein n=1 Tax=Phytophthora rubi TaxID=129364 RepID=A0A6A3M6T5_9STRA|nr:hypothetical protein PR002_g10610 [Phytophthora rubi]
MAKPSPKAPAKKNAATKVQAEPCCQAPSEEEVCCQVSGGAEESGTTALEEARKKLEDIAASKAKKRQKTNVLTTPEASPMRYDMFLAIFSGSCSCGTSFFSAPFSFNDGPTTHAYICCCLARATRHYPDTNLANYCYSSAPRSHLFGY